MTREELELCTKDYWLLSCQHRGRLDPAKLRREELQRAFKSQETAQDLINNVRFMPPKLASIVMDEAHRWNIPCVVYQPDLPGGVA